MEDKVKTLEELFASEYLELKAKVKTLEKEKADLTSAVLLLKKEKNIYQFIIADGYSTPEVERDAVGTVTCMYFGGGSCQGSELKGFDPVAIEGVAKDLEKIILNKKGGQ